MVRFLIAVLLIAPLGLKAQQPLTFLSADSITYQCFLKGDWKKLISTGKQAINQNIDYKRLRQRMGFAYFIKADFYAAENQYEKALNFDKYDSISCEYLYYCGLNTGNQTYARYYARNLSPDLKKKLKIKAVKPIETIDLEYNYKSNNSQTRSNPTYLRTGLSTQLGYRIKLYQSVSYYQQTIDLALTRQPEYFALFSWSVTSKLSMDLAYHFLNTSDGGYKIPGNLLFVSLSTDLNRFNFGANGSMLSNSIGDTKQAGVQAGVTLPGKSNIYFKSFLTGMMETGESRIIYSQIAGARLSKNFWAEGNITLGNLKNYNDYKALYVYNSVDPTIFRTGMTLFWLTMKKMTLFGNYTYEIKQVTNTLNNYQQHSFSGGIIWKL
jgi:tetratricopeptide (TPR) repeat protein